MPDSNYTALLIVLDRSGSMSSIRDDMVGGLEEMLRIHAAEPGLLTVDVVTFDSFSNYRSRVSKVIGADGRSFDTTSDGVPHLVLKV